jgi:hypothetical protein
LKENLAVLVNKTEINGRGDPLRWQCKHLYPQKSAKTTLVAVVVGRHNWD